MHRQTIRGVGTKAATLLVLGVLLWLPARGESVSEAVPPSGSLGEAARQQAEVEDVTEEIFDASEESVVADMELPGFADDPEVEEPDYGEVAEDARGIVAEIEDRLIETHMDDAAQELSVGDGVEGYPRVDEAHVDMKEMIKFCESTGGGAKKACKFRLEISMGMGMGNTLSQLAKGMNPGANGVGGLGQGSQGQGGGSSAQFGIYGPEPFGDRTQPSRSLGNKKLKDVESLNGPPDPIAGDVEELSSSKNEGLQFNAEGDEGVMEAYRPLIEEYFRRMAEED